MGVTQGEQTGRTRRIVAIAIGMLHSFDEQLSDDDEARYDANVAACALHLAES
jgi:hypothetical protein